MSRLHIHVELTAGRYIMVCTKMMHWSAHCYKDANLTGIREAIKCTIEYPVKSFRAPLVQAPALPRNLSAPTSSAAEGSNGATLQHVSCQRCWRKTSRLIGMELATYWVEENSLHLRWRGARRRRCRRLHRVAMGQDRSCGYEVEQSMSGGQRTYRDRQIELIPGSLAVNCAYFPVVDCSRGYFFLDTNGRGGLFDRWQSFRPLL